MIRTCIYIVIYFLTVISTLNLMECSIQQLFLINLDHPGSHSCFLMVGKEGAAAATCTRGQAM